MNKTMVCHQELRRRLYCIIDLRLVNLVEGKQSCNQMICMMESQRRGTQGDLCECKERPGISGSLTAVIDLWEQGMKRVSET